MIYLAPEVFWEQINMDDKEIKKMTHIEEVIGNFALKANVDAKYLFIVNSVARVTRNNVRIF
jgi:hypothetical protein